MSNDHNALEALIEAFRFEAHPLSDDDTHLISTARQDRERLVEELSASVKTVLKYKELLDKSMHNAQEAIELNNKLLAALDPERKR